MMQVGYTRAEVLGKNCRFLQGVATEREPVSQVTKHADTKLETKLETKLWKQSKQHSRDPPGGHGARASQPADETQLAGIPNPKPNAFLRAAP